MKESEQQSISVNSESSPESTKAVSKKNKKAGNKIKTKIILNISDCQYPVVSRVAKNFGWKLQSSSETYDWDICWTDNAVPPEVLVKMEPHQKINHFPGMFNLARKNLMGRYLMKMRKKFPEEYNFFPLTWMLPIEYHQLKTYFDSKQKGKARTFIVKPEAMSQGKGIYLTRKLDEIDQSSHCVVQRYLHKPYLIEGLKFDLRIYVLVASVDPLRLYIFEEGLARFATEQYQVPTKQNMEDICMHLTNYAINKDNPKFVFNNSQKDMTKGHKRSLNWLYSYIQQNQPKGKHLKQKIQHLIVKTMISGLPPISNQYRSCQPENYASNMCFQLLGFDVILTDKCEPILLQINHTPSFSTDTPLDLSIKTNYIQDSLRLMNITQKTKNNIIKARKEACQQRVITGKKVKLTAQEKQAEKAKAQSERDKFQSKNLGGFKKIYPVEDEQLMNQYQQLLNFSQDNYLASTGIKNKRQTPSLKNQKIQSAFGTCFTRKNKADLNTSKTKGSIKVQAPQRKHKPITLTEKYTTVSPLKVDLHTHNTVSDKQIKQEQQINNDRSDFDQQNFKQQQQFQTVHQITKSANNIRKQNSLNMKISQSSNQGQSAVFQEEDYIKQGKSSICQQIKTAKLLKTSDLQSQFSNQKQTSNSQPTPQYNSNKNITILSPQLTSNNTYNSKAYSQNLIFEKRISHKNTLKNSDLTLMSSQCNKRNVMTQNISKNVAALTREEFRNPKNVQILFDAHGEQTINGNLYQNSVYASNAHKKQQQTTQKSQKRGISVGFIGAPNTATNRTLNQNIISNIRKANPPNHSTSTKINIPPTIPHQNNKIPITLNTLLINGYEANAARNLKKILSMNGGEYIHIQSHHNR